MIILIPKATNAIIRYATCGGNIPELLPLNYLTLNYFRLLLFGIKLCAYPNTSPLELIQLSFLQGGAELNSYPSRSCMVILTLGPQSSFVCLFLFSLCIVLLFLTINNEVNLLLMVKNWASTTIFCHLLKICLKSVLWCHVAVFFDKKQWTWAWMEERILIHFYAAVFI